MNLSRLEGDFDPLNFIVFTQAPNGAPRGNADAL